MTKEDAGSLNHGRKEVLFKLEHDPLDVWAERNKLFGE